MHLPVLKEQHETRHCPRYSRTTPQEERALVLTEKKGLNEESNLANQDHEQQSGSMVRHQHSLSEATEQYVVFAHVVPAYIIQHSKVTKRVPAGG